MNSWVFFISLCMIFVIARSMPGGWRQVTDLNSPEIQKYSQIAAEMVSKGMNSPYHLKLVNVTKAETQVVSGMNYRLGLDIGQTNCKKSKNLTKQQIKDCPLQKCEKILHCTATLWVQAWRNSYKVTDFSCQPGKSSC